VRRLRLEISGVVQGVSFRWHTQRTAAGLALAGWVRNRPDGSVEAIAEGPEERLRELARWARRGPEHARVDAVREEWSAAQGDLPSPFEIARA
jgi:acylphosphatase